MKKLSISLAIALASIGSSAGCGDDSGTADTGTPMMDTGTPMVTCPFEGEQSLPCCYRTSNADRLDAPELRVSGIQLSSPSSLASLIVTQLLANSLNDELFNWLITADVTGEVAEITTGYGEKNDDATFSFVVGTAPAPGDANRWDPVMITGSLVDEVVTAPELDTTFTVPVFDEAGTSVQLELPLRNLTLVMANLAEERTCVGVRRLGGGWATDQGRVTAYLTTADADAGRLVVEDAGIDTTLCLFTAGIAMSAGATSCFDVDQAEWGVQPDSLCEDAGGCAQDPGDGTVCDPDTTCNAWYLEGGFAAQGVTISE